MAVCCRLARDVSVDERMVGFKGRHVVVQYMPNKRRHPWGVKLWILAESDTGYTYLIDPYRGRLFTEVPSPSGLGYDVVMRMVRNVTFVCEESQMSIGTCTLFFS